jgi:hypothetical protein
MFAHLVSLLPAQISLENTCYGSASYTASLLLDWIRLFLSGLLGEAFGSMGMGQ